MIYSRDEFGSLSSMHRWILSLRASLSNCSHSLMAANWIYDKLTIEYHWNEALYLSILLCYYGGAYQESSWWGREEKKTYLIFGSGIEINEVVLFISVSVKRHLTLLATSLKRELREKIFTIQCGNTLLHNGISL